MAHQQSMILIWYLFWCCCEIFCRIKLVLDSSSKYWRLRISQFLLCDHLTKYVLDSSSDKGRLKHFLSSCYLSFWTDDDELTVNDDEVCGGDCLAVLVCVQQVSALTETLTARLHSKPHQAQLIIVQTELQHSSILFTIPTPSTENSGLHYCVLQRYVLIPDFTDNTSRFCVQKEMTGGFMNCSQIF